MSDKTCALTGATGFLGGNILEKMKASGWNVVRLQRQKTPDTESEDSIIPFTLGKKIDPASLSNVNLLIHCAYDFSCTDWSSVKEINIEGTKLLLDAARSAGVDQIIYISSMHAFEGCRTMYGKAKLEGEQTTFDHEGIVIRPGTLHIEKDNVLYGGLGGGTLHVFEKLFNITPVVPILHSVEPTVYTTQVEDLLDLIEEALSTDQVLDRPICAVNQHPHTLKQFLLLIKNRTNRKKVLFIPIPWRLPWLMLIFLEKLKLKLPMRSEAILGFFDQNPNPDFNWHKLLRTRFRPF